MRSFLINRSVAGRNRGRLPLHKKIKNKWLFINKLSSFAVTFVNKFCCGVYNISTHKVI